MEQGKHVLSLLDCVFDVDLPVYAHWQNEYRDAQVTVALRVLCRELEVRAAEGNVYLVLALGDVARLEGGGLAPEGREGDELQRHVVLEGAFIKLAIKVCGHGA